jgi:hypothetical protein
MRSLGLTLLFLLISSAAAADWRTDLAEQLSWEQDCKVAFLSGVIEREVEGRAVVIAKAHCEDASTQVVREEPEERPDRVGGSLAQAADRGVRHRPRELQEQCLVPPIGRHQRDRLLATDPAWGALPAALVREEAQQVERDRLEVVLIGKHDHRVRADEAAVLLEPAEIQVWPRAIPPAYSPISSFAVMPAGATFTPGWATRPETE